MKNILLVLMTVFLLGMVDSKKEEPVDVWYRTAPDENNEGQTIIVKLDMTVGFAYCDGQFIYLLVKKYGIDELVVMSFVNGDYWVNDESYWTSQEVLEEEMRSRFLEDHFKKESGKIESIK